MLYPAVKDFSLLGNNREQALGRASSLEKRLLKTGRKSAYDEQLQDSITRGAILEIPDDEMRTYDGPFNYVDHHGVESENNTTPYRFVINSSLDNNGSGISLNDCLPKGPKSIAHFSSASPHLEANHMWWSLIFQKHIRVCSLG